MGSSGERRDDTRTANAIGRFATRARIRRTLRTLTAFSDTLRAFARVSRVSVELLPAILRVLRLLLTGITLAWRNAWREDRSSNKEKYP